MNWSPYSQPEVTKNEKPSNRGKFFVIGLVLVGIWLFSDNFKRVPPNPNPNDDTVVVDPDNNVKPDDKAIASLKDSYIVRVYETEADKQKAWLVKLLDADALWIDWIASQGMFITTLDPTSNPIQAESFLKAASARSIEPPFYLHAQKGGKVLNVVPFKEGMTTEDIKKSILSKVKQ